MKSDRFKKPATLSRFARQLEGQAEFIYADGQSSAVTDPDSTALVQLKSLTHTDIPGDSWHALFAELLEELGTSPLAAAQIKRAMKKGWSIALAHDRLIGESFYTLDTNSRTIILDHGGFSPLAIRRSAHCREALMGSLVRALRDIGHEMRLGAYEISLRPDAVLMMERARSADIETITVMIAWELRGAGFPGLWRHLLGSEDGDIALTFGYTIEKNPKSLYDGKALAASFLRWYADTMRINACDYTSLEMLDALLQEHEGKQDWGKGSFSIEDARDLSILPDGLAYLKEEAKQVVSAPEFLNIPDAINEAHLFQISHDLAAVRINGVPFRSAALARLIFPTAS